MKHHFLNLEKQIGLVKDLTREQKIAYLVKRKFRIEMIQGAPEDALTNTVIQEYAIDDEYGRKHD